MTSYAIKNIKLVAALITGCFFVWSCENDEAVLDMYTKKKVGIEEARQIESYLSQNGKVKAKLTAPYMLRYQADSPYIEFPKTLHVDFFDDTARIESTLDARYARYIEYDNRVFLRDSIVVINIQKGDTLRTSELWWDQKKEEFYTDKPVQIHQKRSITNGIGLTAKQDFSLYEIYKITGHRFVSSGGIAE
jgi:LPS export ABC transporter protein LptC